MLTRVRMGLAVAALVVLGACGGNAAVQQGAQPAPEAPISVTVHNNAFNDVDVYAINSVGTVDFVGMVTATSTGTLTLPSRLYTAGTLRLIAHPIGGRGVARTQPLAVNPGEMVEFTIQNNLDLSTATVR